MNMGRAKQSRGGNLRVAETGAGAAAVPLQS
jgi:hypothetical protein